MNYECFIKLLWVLFWPSTCLELCHRSWPDSCLLCDCSQEIWACWLIWLCFVFALAWESLTNCCNVIVRWCSRARWVALSLLHHSPLSCCMMDRLECTSLWQQVFLMMMGGKLNFFESAGSNWRRRRTKIIIIIIITIIIIERSVSFIMNEPPELRSYSCVMFQDTI